MCDPIIGGALAGALGSAGAATAAAAGLAGLQIYQGEKSRKAQAKASADAATAADQAYNKANPKQPDAAAMLSGNKLANSSGAGSTMLTGSLGVDPAQLTLGKTTLLGGG